MFVVCVFFFNKFLRCEFSSGGEMSSGKYHRHCNFLYKQMATLYTEKIEASRAAVFRYYTETLHKEPNQNGILDVDVSFDCSWMRRGHKSHIGIGFAVEVNLLMVLDLDVLCNKCRLCNSLKMHKCHKNFDGTSGSMEAEIAARIWSRTTDYKMRFTSFIGDGDSSAYNAVCRLNEGRGPYEVPVVKEECVNHVSKRMGARLRKLKKEAQETYTTKTGKKRRCSLLGGANMLTDDVIDKLSSYYGKAIRDNVGGRVKTMEDSVWASFHHISSTNDNPKHHLCPKGEKSWCFYQRAVALQLPDSAKDHTAKKLFLAKIPLDKLELIENVYRDLGNPDLLKRCLKGATQNPNESLYSKVWNKCPKTRYHGLYRVTFLVRLTAIEHNFGYKGANVIERITGTDARLQKYQEWKDKERSRHATPSAKKRRTTKKDEKDQDYEAGGF